MKELYLSILQYLESITELNYIDKDKGQLEAYQTRPAVAFPCALIKLNLPTIEKLGKGVQRCTADFTIRLAFDYVGATSSQTPTLTLHQSLNYFDVVEKVQNCLQDSLFKNHTIRQVSAIEETRPDGLLVLNVRFATTYTRETPK
jgi:hypothetical protein